MKRILSIIVLSSLIITSAFAATKSENAKDTTNLEIASDSVSAVQIDPAKHDSEELDVNENTKKEATEPSHSSWLSLISIILAGLALGVSVFVFVKSRSNYNDLYDRYHKVKEEMRCLRSDISSDVNRRIDLNASKIDGKLIALKEQILEELKSAQAAKVESVEARTEIHNEPETPVFVSKTCFGVYKPKAKGVYVDQITSNREGNSTFKIVTLSDNEAEVHLVENLTKTQFSGLVDDAIQVIEGNPLSYEHITEKEAGRMVLNDDVWTLTQNIKVKLS